MDTTGNVNDEDTKGEKNEAVKVEKVVDDTFEEKEGKKINNVNKTKVVEKEGLNN